MLQTRLYLILLMCVAGFIVVLQFGVQNQISNIGLLNHNQMINTDPVDSGHSCTFEQDSCTSQQNGSNSSPKSANISSFTASEIVKSEGKTANSSTKNRITQKNSSKLSSVTKTLASSSPPSTRNGSSILLKRKSFDPFQEVYARMNEIENQHEVPFSPSHWKSVFYPISGMPVMDKQSVVRILVVTYFRTGSTFLGDILQQNWKTFYHFEPLHMMSVDSRIKDDQELEALNLIRKLFVCDFTNSTDYVKWASNSKRQFLFHRNRFLWATCRLKIKACFFPKFVKEVCSRATVQVMKVTRLHMHHIEKLLEDNSDLDIKVVHLVRDPRGTISSRKVLDWCNKTKCVDPQELCSDMSRDAQEFLEMRQSFPKTFYQVRYEDISLNPIEEAHKMYKALGLPFTPVVKRFINTHTHARKAEASNPYSTRRNSSEVAFEWRHRLRFEEIKRIQSECCSVMETLGYKTIESQKKLDSSIPIIKKS